MVNLDMISLTGRRVLPIRQPRQRKQWLPVLQVDALEETNSLSLPRLLIVMSQFPILRFLFVVVTTSILTTEASAQFESSVTAGTWTAFLPEYEGLTPGGIDQSDVGGRVQFHSLYHFAPTRTMAELRATLAGADISGENFTTTTVVPGIASSVRSRVLYNDIFIGMRDKFDLTDYGLGKITLGAGFSHMHFDQTFDFEGSDAIGLNAIDFNEELQSSYVGGEIVGSMTRRLFGRKVYFDGSFGIYDLNADYEFDGVATVGGTPTADTQTQTFSDVAYTLNLTLKTDFKIAGIMVRPTTGIQYISSMPGITVTDATTDPSVLREDDAFILNGGWEFIF